MAQADPSQSTGRDTGTNPAEGFGLFKVDLADHLNVSTIQRLSILLGLKPGEIDSIKRSKTPGLEMVNLLDERGFITPTDIRDLLKMLRKFKLAGLAARIQSSFQTKTSQAKKDQDLEEKKRDFIKYSKTAYRKHYETAKPFPSMSKCSVNSIFVEGGIYYLAQEGDSKQKPDVLESLQSYNDILSSPKTKSKRKIIEADPGFGKTTLASQFAYDWCTEDPESPLKDVEILIFLQLRQLTGVKSIYTAIKNSIVPKDEDMDEACIKEILKVYKKSVVMLFDSYDEYPDKNETETDIFSIIEMKMFLDVLVIILTRTLILPPNLHPETKRIRLAGFGVAERRNYVLKAVADDVQLADRIEEQLQRNPFLSDLCQVPLFSTMVAHIVHERPEIDIFSTVTRFVTSLIACVHNHMKIKKDANSEVPAFQTELAKLYRIAFDGLTQKNQQLAWEKTYLVSELGQEFYDNYIKLGMLAQEVVFDESQWRYKTVARIWHKIICEFYASHHLVWILSEGVSSAASSIKVKETLNSINPLDLQYVYRFACGLNKPAADIIIKHLQETEEGRQFAILCMFEQEEKSDQFMQSVKDLVSTITNIYSFDAKLLQRSTIQVLEVASAKQIPISCVNLHSCSPRVDESGLNLILQSGLSLSILSSLQKLWIYDEDRRLTNEELAAILSYSSQCTSLKELTFQFYDLPDTIPVGSIPSSLKSRNVKVWNFSGISQHRRLNLQTGQWQVCADSGYLPEEGYDWFRSSEDDTDEEDDREPSSSEDDTDEETSDDDEDDGGGDDGDGGGGDDGEADGGEDDLQDEHTVDVTTSHYNQPTDSRPTPDKPSVPSHQEAGGNPAGAEAMTIDSEEVTYETLQNLTENLSNEWRFLGRKLKLKEADLCNIEVDNKSKGQKEVVYQMLLLWKKKRGMAATNKTLIDALKAAGRKDLHDHFLKCGKFETTSVWNHKSNLLFRLNLQTGLSQPCDRLGRLPGEEGYIEPSSSEDDTDEEACDRDGNLPEEEGFKRARRK